MGIPFAFDEFPVMMRSNTDRWPLPQMFVFYKAGMFLRGELMSGIFEQH